MTPLKAEPMGHYPLHVVGMNVSDTFCPLLFAKGYAVVGLLNVGTAVGDATLNGGLQSENDIEEYLVTKPV